VLSGGCNVFALNNFRKSPHRFVCIHFTAIPQEFRKNGWKFNENLPHGRS